MNEDTCQSSEGILGNGAGSHKQIDMSEEWEIPPIGCMWKAYPSIIEIESSQKVLLPNNFPYYLEDGIEHWCLWKLKEPVTEDDIKMAKDDLKFMTINDAAITDNKCNVLVDTMHWINPIHLKSVPDIDHAHILCLRR